MREIKLTNSDLVALVDDEDYAAASEVKWRPLKTAAGHTYAYTGKILLHRLVTKAPKGLIVDHIDGDGLNNQKSNLRLCTHSQNKAWGTAKSRPNNTSGYRGVLYHGKKWSARIRVNYTRHVLGSFDTKEAAALAYNEAALKHFGPYARLNNIMAARVVK
jgi:hypothetical protein